LPVAEQERFERALTIAQQAYPLREDNEPYTISGPTALVRYAALELGQWLARRGRLDRADEVFLLAFPDARAALKDGQDRRSAIVTRRAERAWIDAHPGPASYGTPPGPPPPLDHLPPEVQRAMHALQWHTGHVFGFDIAPGTPVTDADHLEHRRVAWKQHRARSGRAQRDGIRQDPPR
jgi:pyruvate,water dikinase